MATNTNSLNAFFIINAGSSSIKFSIYQEKSLDLIYSGIAESLYSKAKYQVKDKQGQKIISKKLAKQGHDFALEFIINWLKSLDAINIVKTGHRIVHGGTYFTKPEKIDSKILNKLKKLIPLAPLHQPHNINAIEKFRKHFPKICHIACFDTAFHSNMPKRSKDFGLPKKYYDEGLRRYGFHGISYDYICNTLKKETLPKKLIIAHLGAGASICAVNNGKSIATTMGFTPLDGILMATRAGAIDPGAILYLMREKKMSEQEISDLLHYQSGLLGVSGISSDMRELAKSSKADAKHAIELFCSKAASNIAALAASLSGIDCLVFTGGIGENQQIITKNITKKLSFLGKFSTKIMHTDEEKMIAQYCQKF